MLVWDQLVDRQYQLGIDRGVLYPAAGSPGEVWNGLVSVDEDSPRSVNSYFQDGVKFFEHSLPVPYAAKIEAFTYPSTLELLMGVVASSGIHIHDQPAQRFHLSYRSMVGSEADGPEHAYKIHLLYNLLATPDGITRATNADKVAPATFSFNVTSIPVSVPGAQATTHISIDSRDVDSGTLTTIEDALYGASGTSHILFPDDLV